MSASPPAPPAPRLGRRPALWALAGGALALQGSSGAGAAGGHGPAATLPALRRGVNLSHWFEYERGQGLTADELAGLQARGLDHVRLPLDPRACGWQPGQPQQLPFLAELRTVLDQARDAGLAVVLDLHLEPAFKAEVEANPAREAPIIALWQALAGALAERPPAQLAFQLFNEPQYYGLQAWRWPLLQKRLLAAVRQQAPAHLVLLSGNAGGSLAALLDLVPPAGDAALAASFNHYDPFLFTHQGVPWLDEQHTAAGLVTNLRYPAARQAGEPVRLARRTVAAERALARHLAEGWGPQRIAQDLARAGAWARAHRLPVVCTEFGAFRATVDADSRHRWLHDMRQGLEAQGLGWTVWDYSDHFGLTAQSGQPGMAGRRSLEPAAVLALGLVPAPAGRSAALATLAALPR